MLAAALFGADLDESVPQQHVPFIPLSPQITFFSPPPPPPKPPMTLPTTTTKTQHPPFICSRKVQVGGGYRL